MDDYKTAMKEIKENYDGKDIFNLDITSQLMKNISRRSYVIEKEYNKGIKIDKNRITFLAGISIKSEKLKI